jgi:hypothetical protein
MARVTDSSKRHGTMVYDDTCVDFLYLYLDFIYIYVCVCIARGDAPLSGALVVHHYMIQMFWSLSYRVYSDILLCLVE